MSDCGHGLEFAVFPTPNAAQAHHVVELAALADVLGLDLVSVQDDPILTVGRVELGLGTGAFWDAIVAAGGPRRSPREAVDALRRFAKEVAPGVRELVAAERAHRAAPATARPLPTPAPVCRAPRPSSPAPPGHRLRS